MTEASLLNIAAHGADAAGFTLERNAQVVPSGVEMRREPPLRTEILIKVTANWSPSKAL